MRARAGAGARGLTRARASLLARVLFLRTHPPCARALPSHAHPLARSATRGGHLDTMRALISAGAHIHGAHGQRPALCWAADAGQLPALQLLLSGSPASKARVNERDAFGFTALLDAARGGHVAIVEALLAAGADVNAQTATGSSALIFAAGDNNGALVAALLRAQPAPTLALATAAGYTAERTARVSGHMALALHLHGLAKAV